MRSFEFTIEKQSCKQTENDLVSFIFKYWKKKSHLYHRIKNKFRISSGCPGLSASAVETEYQKVNFLCHLRPTSLIICSDGSGGSRISRGGATPKGGTSLLFDQNRRKLHENEEN